MTTIHEAARTGLGADQVQGAVRSYRQVHDDGAGAGEETRRRGYDAMVNQYYDLVTDFYEYGWGQSFHFAPRRRGESLRESILRHEHHLALRLGLGPGMTALDVGCGVGGPARNIARLSGAQVVGLNINGYQVGRARQHTRRAGQEALCSFVEADFMDMPAEAGTYDAAYAIESTCHAPDRAAAFAEVHRVLRPGALFAGYEWCLTDHFDPAMAAHQAHKKGIEEGDGLPGLDRYREVDRALGAAGFQVIETRDLAGDCDAETPWYRPLAGGDLTLAGLGRTTVGRRVAGGVVRLLERSRLAPAGASEVHDLLIRAADCLVAAGRAGIFTPLYFFLARKGS